MGLPDRDPGVLAARLAGCAPPLTQHVLDLAVLDAPAENRGLLDQAIDAEERERVRLAVARLSDPYREIVTMRFFGELSILEIAAAVGRPEGTIEAQLHRGLKRLRDELEGSRRDGLHHPETRTRSDRHRITRRRALAVPCANDGTASGTTGRRVAILALQRYVDATDLRPSDGLAMRVRLRIAAEPATRPPSRLRSAIGMFGVRPAPRPTAWTPASGSGRLPMSGLVRFKALGMALATVLVVGGGAAAGLAGVQMASAVTGESPKHHDRPSLIRGPVTPSSEPSRWPSAIPVYPFGVGWGSAPDAVPLRLGTGRDRRTRR